MSKIGALAILTIRRHRKDYIGLPPRETLPNRGLFGTSFETDGEADVLVFLCEFATLL